jgi:phenylpropionate dioxygenase-like ring-hydroxylating dioxygenase large terminal subunit
MLEKISLSLGKTEHQSESLIKANWKINIENALEAYHVGFIHRDTFVKMGHKEAGFTFHGHHSGVVADFSEKLTATWRNLQSKIQTAYEQQGYAHWFVFPNLLVAGSYGLSFSFSSFSPTSSRTALFNNRLFQVRPSTTVKTSSLLDNLMESVKDFNKQVFDEDIAICEIMQKGIEDAEKVGILSDEEERVCAFQRAYFEHLHETDPSSFL